MKESEKDLIQESFVSIRAYLNNPKELENEISKVLEDSDNLEEFIEEFSELSSNTSDTTQKTDQRIFLNNLKNR
ncbi:MAG: hypothetical protein KGY45_03485 [Hadesarchaea archaeon]|nr:hypothetical protein [Hadesarchaea archaeon]